MDIATNGDPMIVQVAPGIQAVLRGTHETWEVPHECVVCSSTLFVIQDVAYVLCPLCFSIASLEGAFINRTVSGIGIGFAIEDLTRWQLDALREDVSPLDELGETGTAPSSCEEGKGGRHCYVVRMPEDVSSVIKTTTTCTVALASKSLTYRQV
jgi:hypothetical protein